MYSFYVIWAGYVWAIDRKMFVEHIGAIDPTAFLTGPVVYAHVVAQLFNSEMKNKFTK
jgi:hypothetical protein